MWVPRGTEWRRGLDGVVAGLALVFVAKLPLLSVLKWRLVPVGRALTLRTRLGGTPDAVGFLGSVGLSPGVPVLSVAPNAVFDVLLGVLLLPFFLFGVPSLLLEMAILWVGGWIAILVPGWYWIGRPLVVWWRTSSPLRRLGGVLLRLLL